MPFDWYTGSSTHKKLNINSCLLVQFVVKNKKRRPDRSSLQNKSNVGQRHAFDLRNYFSFSFKNEYVFSFASLVDVTSCFGLLGFANP